MKTPEGTPTKFGPVFHKLCLGRPVFLCPYTECFLVEEKLSLLLLHLSTAHSQEILPSTTFKASAPHELAGKTDALLTKIAVVFVGRKDKEKDGPGFHVRCPVCPFTAPSEMLVGNPSSAMMEKHVRCHIYPGKHPCSVCTFSAGDLEGLKEHLEVHEDGSEAAEKLMEMDPNLLYSNQWSSEGKILKRCAFCPQTEVSKEEIEAHLGKHGTKGEFECEECNFRDDVEFLVKDVHKSVHLNGESFERSLSPSLVTSKAKRSSNGCSVVGSSNGLTFTRHPGFPRNVHLLLDPSMDGTEPEEPSSSSTQNSSVAENDESIQETSVTVGEPRKPGKFNCSKCPFSAVDSVKLNKHFEGHVRKAPYKCDICGYSVDWATAVASHRKIHDPKILRASRKVKLTPQLTSPDQTVGQVEVAMQVEEEFPAQSSASKSVSIQRKNVPGVAARVGPVMFGNKIRFKRPRSPVSRKKVGAANPAVEMDVRGVPQGLPCGFRECEFAGEAKSDVNAHKMVHYPATQTRKRKRKATSPRKRRVRRAGPASSLNIIEGVEAEAEVVAEEMAPVEDVVVTPRVKSKGRFVFRSDHFGAKKKRIRNRPKTPASATPVHLPQPSPVARRSRSHSFVDDGLNLTVPVYRCNVDGCDYLTRNRFAIGGHKNSHRFRTDQLSTTPGALGKKNSFVSVKDLMAVDVEKLSDCGASMGQTPGRESHDGSVFASSKHARKITPTIQAPPPYPAHRARRVSTVFRRRVVAPEPVIGYACRFPGCTFVGFNGRSLGGHMKGHRPKTSCANQTQRPAIDAPTPSKRQPRQRPQTAFTFTGRQVRSRSADTRVGPNDKEEEDENSIIEDEEVGVARKEETGPWTGSGVIELAEKMKMMAAPDRLLFKEVGDDIVVTCPYCPWQGTDVLGMMTDHLAFHGADYMFRCVGCNYATTSLETLQLHQMVHDDEALSEEITGWINGAEKVLKGVFNPSNLGITAPARYAPLKIISVLYVETAENGKLFGCPVCPMKSPYQSAIMEHYVRHFIKFGDFTCSLCDLKLATRPALDRHTEAHLKLPNYGIRNEKLRLRVPRADMDRVFLKVGVSLEIFARPPTPEPKEPTEEAVDIGEFRNEELEEENEEGPQRDRDVIYKVRIKKLPEIATETDGEIMFECGICGCLKSNVPGIRRKHLACHGSLRGFTCQFCDFSSTCLIHVSKHEKDHEFLTGVSVFRLHQCLPTRPRPRKAPEETSFEEDEELEYDEALPVTPRRKVKKTLAVSEEHEEADDEPLASCSGTLPPMKRTCPGPLEKKTPVASQKRKSSAGYFLKPASGNKYVHEWQVPCGPKGEMSTFKYMCLWCRFESKSHDEMYVEHVPNHINKGEFKCTLKENRVTCTFSADSAELLEHHRSNHHGPVVFLQ